MRSSLGCASSHCSGAQDHLVAVDRDLVGAHALARVALERAVCEAPVPMMPGTAHEAIDDLAVAERSALVRADIADGEESIAQTKDRDRARPGLDRNRGAGGDVADLADHVFGHRVL